MTQIRREQAYDDPSACMDIGNGEYPSDVLQFLKPYVLWNNISGIINTKASLHLARNYAIAVPQSLQFSESVTLGKLFAFLALGTDRSADKYPSMFRRQMEATVYIFISC